MASPHHMMTIEAENADELLLACNDEACGRRVVIKRSGGFVVLDKGDFFASHSGGRGLTMHVGVRQSSARPANADADAN